MAQPEEWEPTERGLRWASTMSGFSGPICLAHADSSAAIAVTTGPGGPDPVSTLGGSNRLHREETEDLFLAQGATRAEGAGDRRLTEAPDEWRTCFEKDRDRVLHSNSFRRLAGKTQVFVYPEDHQRTRLTHALEVAQVAASIARACRLNVALTEAIALGHDCGHGPGGHASEDAFAPYLSEGFDHAPWGADVSLASLNLCRETLDGIRNHSWSRPAPSSPEGEVVSWADRIAYVAHDREDAVATGIVSADGLPKVVRELCGDQRGPQLGAFIDAVVQATLRTGRIGMDEEMGAALGGLSGQQLRADLSPSRFGGPGRGRGRGVTCLGRALRRPTAHHPGPGPRIGHRRNTGGRDLCGGYDRSIRFSPSRGRARMGSGQTTQGRWRLSPTFS